MYAGTSWGMCGEVRGASQPSEYARLQRKSSTRPRRQSQIPRFHSHERPLDFAFFLSFLPFPTSRALRRLGARSTGQKDMSPSIALIAVEWSCGGTGTHRSLVLAPTLDLLPDLLCKQQRRRGKLPPFPKTVDDHARSPASSIHSLGRRRRHKCHGQARNFNAGGKN